MYQRFQLSHSDVAKIIDAIRSKLDEQGKGAAIAVCDSQGELLGFLRTDGCKLPSATIAMNKAFTAAREQKPSKEIGNSSREKQWPMSNFGDNWIRCIFYAIHPTKLPGMPVHSITGSTARKLWSKPV